MTKLGSILGRLSWPLKILVLLTVVAVVLAPAKIAADGIIKSFKPKTSMQPGILVSLVKDSKDTVEILPANNAQKVYGVVVDPSDVPLTIRKSDVQVFVASTGNFPVLVSNQNGPIKNGDPISSSSTDGVAAKANLTQQYIIGRALADFNGGSSTIFKTSDGSSAGIILAQIAPGINPQAKTDVGIPSNLRKISNSIAGKNVSALRIYGAVLVLFLGIIAAAILLLGGIKSGIGAIGRNPLSRKSIIKSLIQVVIVVGLVFVASLMGIYLLLKL